ncbi:hypothetical protein HYT23_01325 [Candidatus Pacearchaeota archaeon]|nr:hypothetical protein [Candidatus Pacearchaeota archaeon]
MVNNIDSNFGFLNGLERLGFKLNPKYVAKAAEYLSITATISGYFSGSPETMQLGMALYQANTGSRV